ncbi:MAG: K(+)-transporting ATPase subunit F [Tepidisphaeraceae bacterium]
MNWLYVVGAVLSVLLLAYLTVALLKPEKFS